MRREGYRDIKESDGRAGDGESKGRSGRAQRRESREEGWRQ